MFYRICLFVCLSVCPSVYPLDYPRSYERILMKFFGGVERGQSTNHSDFGGDPDHDPVQELCKGYIAD